MTGESDADAAISLVQTIGSVEPALVALGVNDISWLQLIDAQAAARMGRENAVGEVPGEPERLPWCAPLPTAPILILHLHDRQTATGVKQWLGRYFPEEHLVKLVCGAGGAEGEIRAIPLHELDRQDDVVRCTALYIPPLADQANTRTFSGIMNLTRSLRAPGGCPWDREQTHASLKPHLLEETYEVLDALDDGNPALLAEELGDLMFQITIHSQIAAEAGEFTVEDVIESIVRKLTGRHPHVFGELQLESAQAVRRHWESFKQREKPRRASVLEEIPKGLPALPQSNLMQKRAAGVGFEWPGLAEVIAKVEEELEELKREVEVEAAKEKLCEEYGDIVFALVSVARHLRLDPEEALRLANRKFAARFQQVESRVAALGTTLRDLSPEELDAIWQEAKAS